MRTLRLTLQPKSAFGTRLAGDTLFGHLCWALRLRRGEAGLAQLLEGYTEGRPFAVLSDAFPAGLLPRPAMPNCRIGRTVEADARKEDKRRAWLPAEAARLPLSEWLNLAVAPTDKTAPTPALLTQNTINRLTGTTGPGMFAPRRVEQVVYPSNARLEIYAVIDAGRLGVDALREALEDIGASGFGRDASTGLGKFEVLSLERHVWPESAGPCAMTLAPCAPRPDDVLAQQCFYHPVTRFGRHGSVAALSGAADPFKRPILMLRTAAFLTLRGDRVPDFHGVGLGGRAQAISSVIAATVHQGYAPLVPIRATPSMETV